MAYFNIPTGSWRLLLGKRRGAANSWSFWSLAIATGVLYNSWLLGYWLNPAVTDHQVVSVLEITGQPFWWLFVAADIMTSALVIGLLVRHGRQAITKTPAWWLAVGGLGLFAVATVADALWPLHCAAGSLTCGTGGTQLWGVHDITAFGACVGLAISLFSVSWYHYHPRRPGRHRRAASLSILSLLWAASGVSFLLALPSHGSLPQKFFIILSGAALTGVLVTLRPRELAISYDQNDSDHPTSQPIEC